MTGGRRELTKREKKAMRCFFDFLYAYVGYVMIRMAWISYQYDSVISAIIIPLIICSPVLYALKKVDIEWQRIIRKEEGGE